MDASQWPQGIGVSKHVEEESRTQATNEKKPRPQKDKSVNCPRCNSTNTKFCYYNNYSLSQPRYFCKTCRRYWTEGGTLRTVPVGGGSRKNKRSFSSSTTTSSSSSSSKKPFIPDLTIPCFSNLLPPHQNPNKINHGMSSQDLNLAYPPIPSNNNNNYSSFSINNNLVPLQQNHPNNNMDFLKNGISSSKELHTFLSMPISDCNTLYSSVGINVHDFKPTLNFSLDGFDDNNHQNVFGNNNLSSGGVHHQESTSERSTLLFPSHHLDDLKQVASTNEFEQNRGQGGQDNNTNNNNGYWNGMLGGYSW